MNKIERIVYDCVKSSPALKFFIRNVYQTVFDLLPHPQNQFAEKYCYKEDYFFGFHDCTPFSDDDTKVLANHTTIPLRMPKEGETLEVGYFDLDKDGEMKDFHPLGQSAAWNYHKGCRLQWCGNNQRIIFNTAIDGLAKAKIVSIDGKVESIIPLPIDTVSPNGTHATSFNYERLNILMPGYGYEHCKGDSLINENAPESTGLFVVNLETKESQMVLSLKELADSLPKELNASQYKHYVTHSEFSRDGRYISFLHRWIGDDYRKRHSRLIVYDRTTGQWTALPTNDMVSHYIWNSKNQIIAYCTVKEGNGHVCFQIPDNSYERILPDVMNDDGHQTMLTDEVFATDIYPDRRRMASIFLVDKEHQGRKRIAYVYSPKDFQTKDFHKHIACDLHPRISPSGKYICFDTAFTGKRSLCVMQLTANK